MSIADKLTTIAENEPKVFNAGKKAENKAFWDAYLQEGKRQDCTCLFAGKAWNRDTFNPPSGTVIKPTIPTQMFARFAFTGVDLVELLEEKNITLDFSECTSFVEVFYYTGATHFGVIDTRSAKNLNNAFAYVGNYLKTIDLLILKEDGSQTFNTSSFAGNSGVENITIQGVIGQPNIDAKGWTKLNKASITSFINALSSTTTGLSITLSKTAVNNAFETSSGAADGSTSTEWNALISTKSNWTISLV